MYVKVITFPASRFEGVLYALLVTYYNDKKSSTKFAEGR